MKSRIVLFSATLLLVAGVAFAQNAKTGQGKQSQRNCFVDANKNGICDRHEDGTCTVGNGKGAQDGSGRGNGQGRHAGKGRRDGSGRANGGRGAGYVDANKNGICDYREGTTKN